MDAAPKAIRGRDTDNDEITLAVLDAIERDHRITQRSVAQELGIALGLANAYLKRCIRKGLIKVQQVPPRRYAYYLTPSGFAEKSRLTASYFAHSFSFYRRARHGCGEAFAEAATRGWRRVALFGAGDLAEVALLCAREHEMEIACVVDGVHPREAFLGVAVAREPGALAGIDGAIVTDLAAPQAAFDRAAAALGRERVLVPEFLRMRRIARASEAST